MSTEQRLSLQNEVTRLTGLMIDGTTVPGEPNYQHMKNRLYQLNVEIAGLPAEVADELPSMKHQHPSQDEIAESVNAMDDEDRERHQSLIAESVKLQNEQIATNKATADRQLAERRNDAITRLRRMQPNTPIDTLETQYAAQTGDALRDEMYRIYGVPVPEAEQPDQAA